MGSQNRLTSGRSHQYKTDIWLNDRDGKGVQSLNELQPLFDNPRGVGSDKASRLAGTLAIYMLLWPRNFPTDRTVLAAGFWLRSSASNGTDVRRNAKKDRTLARWRAALKDLTTQIMARAGVDRATWAKINYPLARPIGVRGRIQKVQPPDAGEIIPDTIRTNQYENTRLYLPALTAGYVTVSFLPRQKTG